MVRQHHFKLCFYSFRSLNLLLNSLLLNNSYLVLYNQNQFLYISVALKLMSDTCDYIELLTDSEIGMSELMVYSDINTLLSCLWIMIGTSNIININNLYMTCVSFKNQSMN